MWGVQSLWGVPGMRRPRRGAAGPAWSVDATSGKAIPASAAEAVALFAAGGVTIAASDVLSIYGCQEASGDLADAVSGLTLTAAGTTASYRQAVAGWSQLAVTMGDGATTSFASTSASLPDLSAASLLAIAYVNMPTSNPGTIRGLVQLGSNATRAAAEISTSGILSATSGANTTTAAGDIKSAVRPVVVRHNFTASEMDAMTDVAKASPTFGATSAGKRVGIGAGARSSAACGYLYLLTLKGSAAQLTDAQIKTVLQAASWSPAWS